MHAKYIQPHHHHAIHSHSGIAARSRGFSLTELLVVIAIIVLLVGLLLVALAAVQKRTKRTETEATMQQFANACAVFQSEHGFYPGVIPDSELEAHAASDPNGVPISSTENALLHLMGGYRLLSPSDTNPDSFIYKDYESYGPAADVTEIIIQGAQGDWHLKIKSSTISTQVVAQLGEGPFINGKPYAPYFTPDPKSFVVVEGQVGEDELRIPDLVDAWGQPILYIRQSRDRGPIVKDHATATARPQFELGGLAPYVTATTLGEKLADQSASSPTGSIFNLGGNWSVTAEQARIMSVVLSHQAFFKAPPPPNASLYGKPRGAFMMLSAGADHVYFSKVDGPGTRTDPLDLNNIDAMLINAGPKVLEEFDDIRIYGGG